MKKPPPETQGSLEGRRLALRERAWIEACGGIVIFVGKETDRPEGLRRRAPPPGAEEKAQKLYQQWLREGRDKPQPRRVAKPKPALGKIEFFKFARDK